MRARAVLVKSPSRERLSVISWFWRSLSWRRITPPLRLTSRVCAICLTSMPPVPYQEVSTGMRKAMRSLWRATSVRVVVIVVRENLPQLEDSTGIFGDFGGRRTGLSLELIHEYY